MKATASWVSVVLVLAAGCTSTARLNAPDALISGAQPEGFSPAIRLLSPDLVAFDQRTPDFIASLRTAASNGTVNILSLSGGGSNGAFGAGALYGLSRRHSRPEFQLVTGVSAGALIAPFAFLGASWDEKLKDAFAGEHSLPLLRSAKAALVARLVSPLGSHKQNALSRLVDHYVTAELLEAVARESAKGRQLVVATTDLDKQETVIWNMGVIAAQGGEAARLLFRDVLVASASVPGIFPPVLIHVRGGARKFDELHVDGGITTPLFFAPLMAVFHPTYLQDLRGAHLYLVVNGQLAHEPETTTLHTPTILARSLSAGTTYRTREAINDAISLVRQSDMTLHLTEIPADYPEDNFVDFSARHMRSLFDYGLSCAQRNLLWVTPEQSVRRNLRILHAPAVGTPRCPGDLVAADRDGQER